jgi:hypothetical protein
MAIRKPRALEKRHIVVSHVVGTPISNVPIDTQSKHIFDILRKYDLP